MTRAADRVDAALAWPSRSGVRAAGRRPHLAAGDARPATLSRNDNGDAQLNEWILAWVAHQLPRAPLQLFQANIFYPAQDTLAFSEPLIVPALLGAPRARGSAARRCSSSTCWCWPGSR